MAEEGGFLNLAGLEVRQVRHLAASKSDFLNLGGRETESLPPRGVDLPDAGIEIFPVAGDHDATRQRKAGTELVVLRRFRPGGHDHAFDELERQCSASILEPETQ